MIAVSISSAEYIRLGHGGPDPSLVYGPTAIDITAIDLDTRDGGSVQMGTVKARFRCDNCGHHVPLKHNACPSCGKVFTSVVCPKCHFEDEAHLFTNGCPDCGYQGHEGGSGSRPRGADTPPRKGLPSWVYLWTSLGLLALLVILVLVMFQR